MSPVKEEAIRIIQSLPESCTYEDIQYVEKSLEVLDRGEGISEDDADREILLANVKMAIEGCLETLAARSEPLPVEGVIITANVDAEAPHLAIA